MISYICTTVEDPSDREFMLWLYQEFKKLMLATVRQYVSNPSDCEDIIQDCLVKLIEKIPVLREKKRCVLCCYVVYTIRNASINYLRRQKAMDTKICRLEEQAAEIAADEPSMDELMIAMDTAYNADSASKYEPLTDEEKDAMSEKEVEKWEQKIKDSLLRRDSTLNSVSSAMRNVMRGSYSINGKDYSLSSFGIKTLGYFTSKQNERNAYHIDGDPDDTNVALNSDKLKAAIADDPDAVMEFFQKLSTDMYSTLTEKMKSTKLSSAYTVYNDKQMKTEYEAYEKDIKRWEERIAAMEDKYYKQFAAMETALSKLQSSTASLTSLLGGGA